LVADPSQGGWLLGLGLAFEAQGLIEEARTAYRNALERGQFKPEVILFLRERSGLSAS
jgi:Flp pilus assembly protein TadD